MLPFVYAPLDRPTNGDDLPDSLPFVLDIQPETGTLVQVPNETVSGALSKAYQKGSTITGAMDETGIGRQYADDFLSFLKQSLGLTRFDDKRVLEIGCGTGYLLYRLKLLGADVLGVEPGVHGQEGSKRFHVPIIRDFFPSPKIHGEFDLIILYGVLEHIQSSSTFLPNLPICLKENGRIAISVPDCSPYIEVGDISMLACEHYNYYTETSLRNSTRRFMKLDIDVRKSSFGGCLYAITTNVTPVPVINRVDFSHYRHLAISAIEKLFNHLECTLRGECVGIYVPARAINILSVIREKIDLSMVRFFDDNPLLHGTYLPGFDIPIESRKELIEKLPDKVLIMSRTFGNRIVKELGLSLKITTWDDLFVDDRVEGERR